MQIFDFQSGTLIASSNDIPVQIEVSSNDVYRVLDSLVELRSGVGGENFDAWVEELSKTTSVSDTVVSELRGWSKGLSVAIDLIDSIILKGRK